MTSEESLADFKDRIRKFRLHVALARANMDMIEVILALEALAEILPAEEYL